MHLFKREQRIIEEQGYTQHIAALGLTVLICSVTASVLDIIDTPTENSLYSDIYLPDEIPVESFPMIASATLSEVSSSLGSGTVNIEIPFPDEVSLLVFYYLNF